EPHTVDVRIPRFTLRTPLQLRDILIDMGMPLAFSGKADFSGITNEGSLAITEVVHETFVAVDEAGTEAAGATGVIMAGESPAPEEVKSFYAERPFLFVLRDEPTGLILFMGRVDAPEQAE
ncbi:MAG: serpin family protein, partial [Candidatus Eisenbacteria bacterium]|nr:serpin family protein [Candidatus Eisenbacteria bacterium]